MVVPFDWFTSAGQFPPADKVTSVPGIIHRPLSEPVTATSKTSTEIVIGSEATQQVPLVAVTE